MSENLHERAVCRFRPHCVFGRDSMPTMPVGLAQNTPGQRSLYLKQARAATACDELKTSQAAPLRSTKSVQL